MKYWKLLFLCLVANSCDLDNDTNQPKIDKTELQAIDKAVYKNFIYLDYLKDIANRLEYKISVDGEVNKTIIFFCDSSLKNIETHGEEIRKVLRKKLQDNRCFSEASEGTKRSLKKLYTDEDFYVTITQTFDLNESDLIKSLAETGRKFISHNQIFFDDLKANLEKYKKKLNGGKKERSVEAFIVLCDFLKDLCLKFQGMTKDFDDEQFISFFFGTFLLQYFNIYYENIFRVKENEYGEVKQNLSLISAIQ